MRAATQTSTQQDHRTEPEKLTDLLGELAASSAALVRDEVDLARQEIKENLRGIAPRVAGIAVGALIGVIAVLMLGAAAVIGLGNIIGYGLSALVIGVFLGLVGGSTTLLGIRKIRRSRLKPEQTLETLEEDRVWLKQLR
jgi:hypothetical protein